MRRARWCTSLLVLGLLALAAPAAAHETAFGEGWWMGADHPGWYTPSPETRSPNAEIIGSVSRTRQDSTYRNSDLAFWGDLAYAGHYDGFQIVDVSNPRKPKQLVDYPCPGSQHDVSVWRNLLFVSVEAPRKTPDCGSLPAGPTPTPGFEGIRIFDVSNPRAPQLIAGVPTDCGSHTNTLVPDLENGRVLIYVASYTSTEFAESQYGNVCRRMENGQRAHNKISVVGVPLDNPAGAQVISEPRFEQNDRGTPPIPGYQGCHDITVYMQIQRAAAACMTEGQIWDISDKANPKQIARVHNPKVEFFHSAAFSWDGRTVIFGDEAGGGTGPRCRTQDPNDLGALWFYDVSSLDVTDSTTVERELSHWKVPRIQGDAPNCTMHNFNTLPTKKRDVLVSSAYAAGTTMVDFSDASRPKEVAHVDPHGANTWSAYWYNGHIITNDGGRGVDVMRVKDKRTKGTTKLQWSNPQTQDAVLR